MTKAAKVVSEAPESSATQKSNVYIKTYHYMPGGWTHLNSVRVFKLRSSLDITAHDVSA